MSTLDEVTLPRTVGLGLAIATALVAAGPAGAHYTGTGLSATQERKLERVEQQTLGPEHAAEHAELRRLAAKHVRWLNSLSPAARRRVKARERAKARAHTVAAHAAAALVGDPADVGRWTTGPTPIPVMGINAAVLPTGKVLFWAYPENPNPLYNPKYEDIEDAPNNSLSAVWDPRTGKTKVIPPPINPDTGERTNLWCSGISFLASGEVLATGGNLGYTPDWRGLQRAYIFNPWTETWREVGRMRHGRWYPSQVLLADGRTLVLQGYDETGTQTYNDEVEVFDPATGQFTLVGKLNEAATPPRGNFYPHTFLMPSGRVLVAGPDRNQTYFFDNPGNDMSWTDIPHPAPFQDRQWGTAVLLPGGASGPTKVMQLGGSWLDSPNGVDAVNTTEVFNEADAAAGWQFTPSLNVGRGHANTVLLPDGTMVEVGGGKGTTPARNNQYVASGAEKQVELWNPATGQWRLGPAQVETRAYHSTAVLLPDGRVVSAGDDYDGTDGPGTGLDRDTMEIYSPPYLFKGARPTVTSAPTSVRWNTRFGVASPHADVTRAVLMAPSATTHATDMNQRMLNLPIAKRVDGLGYDVTSPVRATAAPPGVYMLFLLNARGVPSVARWIRLDPNAPPPPKLVRPPAPPVVDRTAPEITSARMTKRRVRTRGKQRGTKFIVRTSEAARLEIRFQRARSGRRTRFVRWGDALTTGTLHRTARVKFSGKLDGRRLRVGRWRAVILATDAAGNRSDARRLRFSVIRSR